MKTTQKYGEKLDSALSTWVKLARAYNTVYKHAFENLRSFGLTISQFAVIEALGHLGPLKVGELCDKMLVTGGNMTLVLDNLEKQELVKRVYSKNDRRAINIHLTDKGQSIFDDYFLKHANFLADKLSVLSIDEQKQLGELLKKLGISLNGK